MADATQFIVLIKPDAVQRGLIGEILSRFEKRGFRFLNMNYGKATKGTIEKHYEEHKGKAFYDRLVDFSIAGPMVVLLVSGDIDVARKIVGETSPSLSEPGTIRGDYSCVLPFNLVHCSNTKEDANFEINLWFGGKAK